MRIDENKCTGCLKCVPFCPMAAIAKVPNRRLAAVDEDECVECGVCMRAKVCNSEALYQQELEWPRELLATFSDPRVEHKLTKVLGRGTEEMKTNEVTGRFGPGKVGMAAELGRPGTGARFYDVEKVAMAIAGMGLTIEPKNPVTFLMPDPSTGKIREDVLNEKVLSAIVEFDADLEQVPAIVARLNEVAKEIDTIFSVDLITLIDPDGTVPVEKLDLAPLGRKLSINGKLNLGMGRPKAKSLEGHINESH
ncbi:MAG TPA: 4Fe-4S binding protein [Chloroflexota bacterium]|nr:4Fe-4S binding protein [Chloroflexota bacterium]